MENIEKFELAKRYFKDEVKRFVSCFHYWNRYSYHIFRSQDVVNMIGEEPLTMQRLLADLRNRAIAKYDFDHRICFGKYTSVLGSREYYGKDYRSRFAWTPYTKPHLPECGNFTWMTKKLLEEHVNYPKKELGLDYDVAVYGPSYSDESAYGKYWEVIFDFKQLGWTEIKFVLFWSRYADEVPSCFALLDAILLKDRYPKEEMFNLIVMASYFQNYHLTGIGKISEGQCLSIFGKFISREHLLSGLRNVLGDKQVLNIFERRGGSRYPFNDDYDPSFEEYDDQISAKIPVLDFRSRNSNSYDVYLNRFFDSKEVNLRLKWYDELYPRYNEERVND